MRVAEAAGGPADRSPITEWRRGKWPDSGEPSLEHIFAAIWAVPSFCKRSSNDGKDSGPMATTWRTGERATHSSIPEMARKKSIGARARAKGSGMRWNGRHETRSTDPWRNQFLRCFKANLTNTLSIGDSSWRNALREKTATQDDRDRRLLCATRSRAFSKNRTTCECARFEAVAELQDIESMRESWNRNSFLPSTSSSQTVQACHSEPRRNSCARDISASPRMREQ